MIEKAWVVEDDFDTAFVFTGALRGAGFDVETIHDGLEAFNELQYVVPRLIVLDLHLPGMDGKDILNFIRNQRKLRNIKVIVASADPQLADYVRDKADFTMIKPVSFKALRQMAARLVGR